MPENEEVLPTVQPNGRVVSRYGFEAVPEPVDSATASPPTNPSRTDRSDGQ